MNKLFSLIICINFLYTGFSQTQKKEGYFGYKRFASIETVCNIPVLYAGLNESGKKYNKHLERKADLFNYGYRLEIGQIINRHFSFVLETGIDCFSIYMPSGVSNYSTMTSSNIYYTTNSTIELGVKQEMVDVRTYSIMPKIELASKNALLPMGISHQLGLGFSRSRIVEKDYTSLVTSNSSQIINPNQYYKDHFYDYDAKAPIKNYTLLYSVNLRTPISKRLMLNYGFRFTYNFHNLFKIDNYANSNPYFYTANEMRRLVNKERAATILNFKLGLSYVF